MSSQLPSAGVGAGAIAGAAAIPGLNALLLPLLLAFGPAALSKMFGGEDPQEKLRRQIMALLHPNVLNRLQGEFYQKNIQSPAFSQAQGAIASGANQTSNQVAQNLAARGLGTSGTGAVLSGLTPSLVGSQVAGLRTAASNQAASAAQQNIASQISALTGTAGPSQNMQLFADGLESFQPYLQAYMRSRFPSLTFTPQAAR